MKEYYCEPKKREEIKEVAKWFRARYKTENCLWFPAVEIMDIFCIDNNVSFDIVSDEEMDDNILADTDIFNNVIRIKESVYNKACSGDGLSRMTIVHEMGHFVLLKIFGFKLNRISKNNNINISTCMDPEWQAKCFAGEVMIDDKLTENMSIKEIVDKCGVSYPAARYQYNISHPSN